MYTLLKKLWILLVPFFLLSCMKEDTEDCAVFLEFIFDYNMEFTDRFQEEIDNVDVYVFDAQGYYLFTKHADCPTDLEGGKRMKLEAGFALGNYKIITVGALTDDFRFTDINNQPLTPGVTFIEDIQLALDRDGDEVAKEFPHLWYGKPIDIEFRADLSVWPVNLIRVTNHFNVLVQYTGNNLPEHTTRTPLYNFDIITPEGGVYDFNNNARIKESVTYHPYILSAGSEEDILSEGKLKTMRLLAEEADGYRLIVRSAETGEIFDTYNLMSWLVNTRPSRADGSSMPLQEYLDRECEWTIIIRVGDSGGDGGFVAVSVIVNGWIVWTTGIEI